MDGLVRWASIKSWPEYIFKLMCLLLLAGVLNHLRDVLMDGGARDPFIDNLFDATFSALPVGAGGLLLLSRMGQMQRDLEWLAHTDQLTELANRRAFLDLVRARLSGTWLYSYILVLDIDHFKRVNDTYGHDAGDLCLVEVARMLSTTLRASDQVARMGGEEFACYVTNLTLEEVRALADRLTRGVSVVAPEFDMSCTVTLSVGVVETVPNLTLETLLRRADEALYAAKAAGRACAVVWSPDLHQSLCGRGVIAA